MFLIRNCEIEKLVMNSKHKPLAFEEINDARRWLHRNGDPEYLTIIEHSTKLFRSEMEQLLKINFQELGWE